MGLSHYAVLKEQDSNQEQSRMDLIAHNCRFFAKGKARPEQWFCKKATNSAREVDGWCQAQKRLELFGQVRVIRVTMVEGYCH